MLRYSGTRILFLLFLLLTPSLFIGDLEVEMIDASLPRNDDAPSFPSATESKLYSTYIGVSNSDDYGNSVAVDSEGCVYVAGATGSESFPVVNPYDSTHNGAYDIFVLKFNPDGTEVLFSTFVGGSDFDYQPSMAIDSEGNVYVTGKTESVDFPIVNGLDSSHNGGMFDVFVFKLNSSGNGLEYSTYIGGSADEIPLSIAVDNASRACVVGYTTSSDFPLKHPIDNEYNDGNPSSTAQDGFVFRLNTDGNDLDFSTYLGGQYNDAAVSLVLNPSGDMYITGSTGSPDFPTEQPYDSTQNGGMDVFVAKIGSSGNTLEYSTFLGGSNVDFGESIVIDPSGNAYVTGISESADFPTEGAYDDSHNGGRDIIAFKLNSSGNGLEFSTFYGGSGYDWGMSIDIDISGTIYIGGYTDSPDLPMEHSSFDQHAQYEDILILRMNSSGNGLEYSSYFGGSRTEWLSSMVVDSSGYIHVTGTSLSSDFPTVNAFDGQNSQGTHDVVLMKLGPDSVNPDLDSPPDFSFEQGTGGNTIEWNIADRNPGQYWVLTNGSEGDRKLWQNGTISVDVDDLEFGVNNITIIVKDFAGNLVSDSVFVSVLDMIPPSIESPGNIQYLLGTLQNRIVWITYDPNPLTYQVYKDGLLLESGPWNGSSIAVNIDGLSEGTYNYTLMVRDMAGHYASDVVMVTVTTSTTSPTTTSQTTPGGFDPVSAVVIGIGSVIVVLVALVIILSRRGGTRGSTQAP